MVDKYWRKLEGEKQSRKQRTSKANYVGLCLVTIAQNHLFDEADQTTGTHEHT